MVASTPGGYRIDPDDPRAPPFEGDPHNRAASGARFTLESHFRRLGRKVYVSSNLAVYYPGEPRFAPDVLVVRDVEPHDRDKWVVTTEGKGLDLIIEVHVAGNRSKDEVENVERYARLGIEEYFVFDLGRRILRGYRLSSAGRRYQRILPQGGRLPSAVLEHDLMLEGDRLRFYVGSATVLDAEELIERLGAVLDEALSGPRWRASPSRPRGGYRRRSRRARGGGRARLCRVRAGTAPREGSHRRRAGTSSRGSIAPPR